MIFLLQGDDIPLIEKAVLALKKKQKHEILEFDINSCTPSHLLGACRTYDIFQNPPFVVLRVDKSAKIQLESFYGILGSIPQETKLLIVCFFALGKTSAFTKNSDKIVFKTEILTQKQVGDVFGFLDFVFLQNRQGAYRELAALEQGGHDAFYIFSMFLYALRNIFYVKFESPEVSELKDYSKRKAIQQAKNFEKTEILELFDYFCLLDKKAKTGQIPVSLLNVLAVEKVLAYTKK